MKYVIVKGDVVVNIVEADSIENALIGSMEGSIAIQSEVGGIGQQYKDGVFSDVVYNQQELKSIELKRAENNYLLVTSCNLIVF